MVTTERRSEERWSFPRSSSPVVSYGGKTFAVLDMCKTGLSFVAPRRTPLAVGDHFSGVLSQRDSEPRPIVGRVVRVNRKCVALRLLLGVDAQGNSAVA